MINIVCRYKLHKQFIISGFFHHLSFFTNTLDPQENIKHLSRVFPLQTRELCCLEKAIF